MPSRLERYQHTYRALADELAAELATVGFISPGSVVSRYTSCGKPGCRCQGNPPKRHGPYYQWSRAIAGKTMSRRLTEPEAELYLSWIANRRRLEQIIAQMQQTSTAAADLLLRQARPPNHASQRSDDPTHVGGQTAREKCGTSVPRLVCPTTVRIRLDAETARKLTAEPKQRSGYAVGQ